ncbi:MAG: hypothetical protein WBG30_03960 [Psychrilyobacter sp.]|uniref:hypothetical protein n=1 Tax=Psychrilyobacter sp. TaxID=2586924 RepID=UPI003C756156
MKYNLFEKEAAPTWELAKEKLIKSKTTTRYNGEFETIFPYNYNEKNTFVYEGELTGPFRIEEDFTIYFYSDRECIELGYRFLGVGEKLVGDKIINVPSIGQYYEWKEEKWVYNISPHKIDLIAKIEKEKDEILSGGFLWNGKYQQRCRAEKDLPYIRETLENFELIPNYSLKWYFSNLPEGYSFNNKEEFLGLRNDGMIFIGDVFKIESELKLKINSARAIEDLAFSVEEEYNKGLVGFTLPK